MKLFVFILNDLPIFAPSKEKHYTSGCSVARLSRRVWDAEVAGSNPATPTKRGLVLRGH